MLREDTNKKKSVFLGGRTTKILFMLYCVFPEKGFLRFLLTQVLFIKRVYTEGTVFIKPAVENTGFV